MKKPKQRFDPTFIAGLVIAAVCIVGGLILEKGDIKDVTQVTAAVIVLGGTIGAVVVSTPKSLLISAIKRAPSVLWNSNEDAGTLIERLVSYSVVARRSGLQELDSVVPEIQDPFLKKGIMLLSDGFTANEIRTVLETDMDVSERKADSDAKVFEAAGGYAPTIGIIGAVLGLIQVMKHLDNMSEVGRGIAVAFVATVYGVSVANLVFLPMGSKIRAQARETSKTREMIIEGVVAIQRSTNPRIIRQLLEPFASNRPRAIAEADIDVAYAEARKAS
jgi:chemotaxis protein MotA